MVSWIGPTIFNFEKFSISESILFNFDIKLLVNEEYFSFKELISKFVRNNVDVLSSIFFNNFSFSSLFFKIFF